MTQLWIAIIAVVLYTLAWAIYLTVQIERVNRKASFASNKVLQTWTKLWEDDARNTCRYKELDKHLMMLRAEVEIERDIRTYIKQIIAISIPNFKKIDDLYTQYRDLEKTLDDVSRRSVADPIIKRMEEIEKEIELIVYPNKEKGE